MNILKTVATAVYERVILAWKSTLLAFVVAIVDVVIDSLQTQHLPMWAHIIVGAIAVGLMAYKKEHPAAPAIAIPITKSGGPTLGGAAVLASVLFLASGCATFRGSSFTASAGGQTVSGSVDEATGIVCTTYTPPLAYMGESCTVICVGPKAPFIDLTCTQVATAALHTVHLVRTSP